MNKKAHYIYDNLESLFPNAKCELNYETPFQLAVAVSLSAQTTDIAVNKITIILFEKYPDAYSLANAQLNDVEDIIHSIGLYHNKAKNIISLAEHVVIDYQGVLPNSHQELEKLPGIGRKSANVIMANCFNDDCIAVDTHVHRVSIRLGIADKNDDVLKTEYKLMDFFDKNKWSKLHHLLIFFGRYMCTSKNPKCDQCPFKNYCTNEKDS